MSNLLSYVAGQQKEQLSVIGKTIQDVKYDDSEILIILDDNSRIQFKISSKLNIQQSSILASTTVNGIISYHHKEEVDKIEKLSRYEWYTSDKR